ncbi:hypothetical protein B0H13DRAFT_1861082 [Mycena leptocephala]|nr:hypothetical protein B0H13DRAFT_1861082 [Mycena leptocephala]
MAEGGHSDGGFTTGGEEVAAERTISAVAGTMYIGGADTTVSSLSRFLLAMMANPNEAQTKVDAVTGDRYRPDFEDESSVPYVTALRRRVLRWQNVMPNGLNWLVDQLLLYTTKFITPFFLITDQSFPGNLPSSLHVQSQSHALGRIYIPLAGTQIPLSVSDEGYALDDMAISSVWIAIVFMLATFDVTKAIDEHGRVIEPSNNLSLPFKCSIRERPPTAVDLSLKLAAPRAVLTIVSSSFSRLWGAWALHLACTPKLLDLYALKSLAGQTPDVYVGSVVPPILFETPGSATDGFGMRQVSNYSQVNITMTAGDLACNQMREIIRCRRWLERLLGSSRWVA